MQVSPAAILGSGYAVLPAKTAFTPDVPGVFIPQTALTGLNVSQLDPENGNFGEVVRALLQRSSTYLKGLDQASKPQRWRVTQADPTVARIPGKDGLFLRQNYTSSHDVESTGVAAAPEV
jgi:hypothetical protein